MQELIRGVQDFVKLERKPQFTSVICFGWFFPTKPLPDLMSAIHGSLPGSEYIMNQSAILLRANNVVLRPLPLDVKPYVVKNHTAFRVWLGPDFSLTPELLNEFRIALHAIKSAYPDFGDIVRDPEI